MRGEIVSLDLETTGLNNNHDRIIEIAAVRFNDEDGVLDEWQSFVNPACPIPAFITDLTGIENHHVKDAPRFGDVMADLRQFVGDAPVLGHSVEFDIGFLRASGLQLVNPTLDTYAIASALLPETPRYGLSALSTEFGVELDGAHRALNDVLMTVGLYQKLWEKVFDLPLAVLAEIVRAGKPIRWGGSLFFEAAMAERKGERQRKGNPSELDDMSFRSLFPLGFSEGEELRPSKSLGEVDIDDLAKSVEPGGALSSAFSTYEYREQQAEMIRTVGDAFNKGGHLLLEAPTGVGKSLGYLIPAAHFALENDHRVVVSTNTVNLQEQLIEQDIPLLHNALGLSVRATVLKGRSHYLCPRRFAALQRRGPTSSEEMIVFARLCVWLSQNTSGDKNQITLRGPVEAAIWRRLSAEDDGCTSGRCSSQMEGRCPLHKARQAAKQAHILIVNHSLLLSDVAAGGRVLPEYRHLIVDEAHHLEDAITNGLSFETDSRSIHRQIAELGNSNKGLLGEALSQCRGVIPAGYFTSLEGFVNSIAEASLMMGEHGKLFFEGLDRFIRDNVNIPRSDYTSRIRIVSGLRQQGGWSDVEAYWDNLSQFTKTIAKALGELSAGLRDLEQYDIPDYDDLLGNVQAASRRLDEWNARLDEMVNKPDSNTIYWVAIQSDNKNMSLHAAPLDVSMMMEEHLWQKRETIVLTSATMQTDKTFSYIRSRLGAEDVEEKVLGSPFDYKSNTLLYLVNDIPEPAERQSFQYAVEQGVLELCRATEGRALILFTSYAQLRQTTKAIGKQLEKDGITVYDQSSGISRRQLLQGFKETEKSILMGTRSFWEGIDVPGDALSVLVIVRLPFSVPNDPLFAARGEQVENSFMQYAVPEATILFRQGFGRLIRRKSDRGVVAIFDRRVISKRYGQAFLNALPECTVRQGPMLDLPYLAADWLSGEG